jgi:F-type H+-transporting ATPase subunit epsilon
MQFTVVTPEGITYQDNITKATIPTAGGMITILDNHAPLVSVLAAGELILHKNKEEVLLAMAGGILEIRSNGDAYLLADNAERAEDIDLERADKARKRAEELLSKKENLLDVDFARIQAKIEREMARISVGKKYRR